MAKGYTFDLIFTLPEGALDHDALMDALFEGGCADALVGTGAAGLIGLSFTRRGESGESVMGAAVEAALSVLPKGSQLVAAHDGEREPTPPGGPVA